MIKWKKGYHYKGDAQACYTEIDKILQRDGYVVAASVVKQAKPKRNPLHDEFTWDDADAAIKCRLAEARSLVNSIEIVTEEHPDAPTRAFHIITVSGKDEPLQKAYRSIDDIMQDPVLRQELLDRALGPR